MPINVNYKNPVISFLKNHIQHYDHERYWKYREYVTNPTSGGGKIKLIIKWLKLLYIKRCDAYNNSSFGTDLNAGALFKTPPHLPHGPNGIIVSPYAKIGANSYIYQQVTIRDDGKHYTHVPEIGDNVIIGAGAKLIGKIKIGNNVKIGANAVVVEDIPNNATVVCSKARVIIRE